MPLKPLKVAAVGSGNWGTTTTKLAAANVLKYPDLFEPEIKMWVYEELIDGEKLTEIINTKHENVKYLPGIPLTPNIKAVPDLLEVVKDANLIIFNIPHQFLGNVCKQLKGKLQPYTRGISCLKGLDVNKNGVFLLSDQVQRELGVHCGVLSGANIASEVAKGYFSETTIAYPKPSDYGADSTRYDVNEDLLIKLFQTPNFHVRCIEDVAGCALGGALKNVVAIAAGFCEGMGWGDNAKAAVERRGMAEMIKFSKYFFPESHARTFYEESCGVADLITSCGGGRNMKVGAHMAKTGDSYDTTIKKILNGQSAQGIITCEELHELLTEKGLVDEYPLFDAVWRIVYGNSLKIEDLPLFLAKATVPNPKSFI